MPDEGAANRPVPAGWGFWLWWVLASTAGWAAGAAMAAMGSYPDIVVGGYVRLALGGILVGGLQSLVLRGQLAAGWWLPASIVAAAVVGVVVFGAGAVNLDGGWVLGTGLFGTVVGVLQWLVLRQQLARAGWWVLASTVGWVAPMPLGGFLGWAALGAVYGGVTGFALVRLLRGPVGSE